MRGKGYSSRISCTDSRNEGSGPAFRQMAVVGGGGRGRDISLASAVSFLELKIILMPKWHFGGSIF